MLHVTNGDSAARRLRQAGVEGEVLPWRDVLHEGPVPAGLTLDALRPVRARFIADAGWGEYDRVLGDFARRDAALAAFHTHDEVVLWFEHDLYDQLQLVQVLGWLGEQARGAVRVSLICGDEYLGPSAPRRLRERFARRAAVSDAAFDLARRAWDAFRDPDPLALVAFLSADLSVLPYLGAAFRRHLEEYPSVRDGLSRTQRQALEAVAAGHTRVRDAFVAAHHAREDRIFLGDAGFVLHLSWLSAGPAPLLRLREGGPVPLPGAAADCLDRHVALTPMGRSVLDGSADFVEAAGIDRWLGGVHLVGRNVWRWDGAALR